jgi:hypothetical protein
MADVLTSRAQPWDQMNPRLQLEVRPPFWQDRQEFGNDRAAVVFLSRGAFGRSFAACERQYDQRSLSQE